MDDSAFYVVTVGESMAILVADDDGPRCALKRI
jgi:hypothetical protein